MKNLSPKKKILNIILLSSVVYLVVGIMLTILMPDDQVASAQSLQATGGFSQTGSYVAVIIRSVVQVIFWPVNVFILLV